MALGVQQNKFKEQTIETALSMWIFFDLVTFFGDYSNNNSLYE